VATGRWRKQFLANGKLVTGGVRDHKVYVFNDTDNQTLASAVSATPYACQTRDCNWEMSAANRSVRFGSK